MVFGCAGVPSLDAAKDFTVDGLTGYNGKKKKKKRRHRYCKHSPFLGVYNEMKFTTEFISPSLAHAL